MKARILLVALCCCVAVAGAQAPREIHGQP